MKFNTKLTLKFFLEYFYKYKWSGFLIIITIVLASVVNLISPIFYKILFDLLSNGLPKNEIVQQLINTIIIIAAIEFIGWILWRIATFVEVFFQAKINADILKDVFNYIHKHSFAFFENNFVGALTKKVYRFQRAFSDLFNIIIWNILQTTTVVIVITGILLWKNILLGSFIIVWVLIMLFANYIFSKYKLKHDFARSA